MICYGPCSTSCPLLVVAGIVFFYPWRKDQKGHLEPNSLRLPCWVS
jgi:hypothetical protein